MPPQVALRASAPDEACRFRAGRAAARRIRIDAPGHTAFHVSLGGDELIVAGDIANLPALFVVNPHWQAVFDMDPDLAEQNRRAMFDRVIADGAVIAGYHFGFPNAGRIRKDGTGYVFEPFGPE